MFRRVIIDEWVTSAPLISFAIIGLVFIVVTIRAIRMSKETRDHLSSLPLQDHTKTESQEKP